MDTYQTFTKTLIREYLAGILDLEDLVAVFKWLNTVED